MIGRALVCAGAVGLVACGHTPHTTVYLKGPPQRVTVTKQAEVPTVEYRAVRAGTTLRIAVRSRTPVRLERKVAKSTYILESRGAGRWEWIETVLGLAASPVLPFILGTPVKRVDGPDWKARFFAHPLVMFPDPRTTFLGTQVDGRLSMTDRFPTKPQTRRYRVSLPLRDQTVRYRVITAERVVATEGEATTSRFGEIAIPDVPDEAVAVEVTHDGRTQLIVIE